MGRYMLLSFATLFLLLSCFVIEVAAKQHKHVTNDSNDSNNVKSSYDSIGPKTRCPVCGMFVAKYPNWLTRVHLSDGSEEIFDGVKDMMVYYFAPQSYGAGEGKTISQILVKDYYNQQWIDATLAVYVKGSDVFGPMGHELIAFEKKAAAENFFKDHNGKTIISFDEITMEMIEMMRKGHKMKGHSMKKN